ncbi:hypothetical protein NL676_030525 [Syzygium grande]|nr:hypothetical protein NL676_030525 [Syzygium grande]
MRGRKLVQTTSESSSGNAPNGGHNGASNGFPHFIAAATPLDWLVTNQDYNFSLKTGTWRRVVSGLPRPLPTRIQGSMGAKDDPELYVFPILKYAGIELQQVKFGTLFANVLVCDDPEDAKKLAEETWGKNKDACGFAPYKFLLLNIV